MLSEEKIREKLDGLKKTEKKLTKMFYSEKSKAKSTEFLNEMAIIWGKIELLDEILNGQP